MVQLQGVLVDADGWNCALKYVCELNGVTQLCITKLDVLEGLSQLNICTAYKTKDEAEVSYPLEVSELEKIEPEYESFPGWCKGTKGVRSFDSLPPSS